MNRQIKYVITAYGAQGEYYRVENTSALLYNLHFVGKMYILYDLEDFF